MAETAAAEVKAEKVLVIVITEVPVAHLLGLMVPLKPAAQEAPGAASWFFTPIPCLVPLSLPKVRQAAAPPTMPEVEEEEQVEVFLSVSELLRPSPQLMLAVVRPVAGV